MRFLKLIRTRELLYSLLLFSGFFKQFLIIFEWTSIDFTLLVGLLLMIVLAADYIVVGDSKALKKKEFVGSVLLLFFVFSMFASLMYTHSESYFITKLLSFAVSIYAYLFPLLAKTFDIKRFFDSFVKISLFLVCLFVALYPLTFQMQDIEAIRDNYLVIGYVCGLNILLLLYLKSESKITLIFFLLVLLLSGARGPLLFTILAYSMLLVSNPQDLKRLFTAKVFMWAIVGGSTCTFLVLQNEYMLQMVEGSLNRMLLLFSDNAGESANIRFHHIRNAIDFISQEPILGYGLGSYGIITNNIDARAYPHNAILEVWFELGLLGLISYLLFCCYHFFIVFRDVGVRAGGVIFYIFLNSLKSSSFTELKFMYGFFAIFLLVSCKKFFIKSIQ